MFGQSRNLCKLKYEIDPDLYIKGNFNVYYEKTIYSIKLLLSPIDNYSICQKNGKTIFYFEWLFDLYDNDGMKLILNNIYGYGQLSEKHLEKLNFSQIEIYVDDELIDSNDIICKDFYNTKYYSIYTVMGIHCYFIYKGEQKDLYHFKLVLLDSNGISFVTYDNKYLFNKNSHGNSYSKTFYSSENSVCNTIKDPFEERISCINNINNCMHCKNETFCEKCNYGFTLVKDECLPIEDYEKNLQYFTPNNGTNYYTCSYKIPGCEECTYDDFSLNKFHCSKCSKGLKLNETYQCSSTNADEENKYTDSSEKDDEFDEFRVSKGQFIGSLIPYYLILFLTILI